LLSTRVVSSRVTELEYEEVESVCALTGRRCILEHARAAVLEFGRSQPLVRGVLERYPSSVDYEITRLLDFLEGGREPGGPSNPRQSR
jgi:hypothetical protein